MDKTVYKNSFPFFPILALIFITLKLIGYITWSWWWVLAPLWAPIAIIFGVLIVIGIVVASGILIGALMMGIFGRKR